MKGIGMSLTAACVGALLLACSNSHGPNAGSSGSNWLKCAELADCEGAKDAVACSSEGFCVDAEGGRIAVDEGQLEPGKAGSAAMTGMDGGPVLQERCLWGIDALLAEVGAEAEDRINCGQYATNDEAGVTGGLGCFEREFTMDRAVEISFNTCIDCYAVTTYLAIGRRAGFVITREADELGPDELKEVSVSACEEIDVELEPEPGIVPAPGEQYPFIGCRFAVERYHCQQPLDAPSLDEPEPDRPVTPLKLGDVSSPGNIARETLHLYVGNQSFDVPLVNIDVMIDDVRVVTGDFDVGSQHSWYAFDILVPAGTHTLHAEAPRNEAELDRTIDMNAERWAVMNYWNDGVPSSEVLLVSVHDQPVSFE